jgi:putative restriction endonuclease
MAVRLVVAITDGDWFARLRAMPALTEVNFWAPSAAPFKALQPGELFLFKLHAPNDYIVGAGIFAYANVLPCSLAWEAFGEANGAASLAELRERIMRYRKLDRHDRSDFPIGCRVLTQPFFLDERDWIPIPASWPRHTQVFKTYTTDEHDGLSLWEATQERAMRAPLGPGVHETGPRYGEPVLIKPRLGQGAFRVLVTDLYQRRCAVTGERTLPALDAAHIQPYAEGGLHEASNGLLLRRDVHSLFDAGYVSAPASPKFRSSSRLASAISPLSGPWPGSGKRLSAA